MANSDAATLTELKTARDKIITAIATHAGGVVMITVRGRTKQLADPGRTLAEIEKLIRRYELKAARKTKSPVRLVHVLGVSHPKRTR